MSERINKKLMEKIKITENKKDHETDIDIGDYFVEFLRIHGVLDDIDKPFLMDKIENLTLLEVENLLIGKHFLIINLTTKKQGKKAKDEEFQKRKRSE